MAENYYNEVTSPSKFLIIDNADHGFYFSGASSEGMTQVIKFGTRDPESALS